MNIHMINYRRIVACMALNRFWGTKQEWKARCTTLQSSTPGLWGAEMKLNETFLVGLRIAGTVILGYALIDVFFIGTLSKEQGITLAVGGFILSEISKRVFLRQRGLRGLF
ncbi:MAG: hypothetical protein HY393_03295 [Candidatus Diapherotrites archaeon]|nr:hypothetical protein [Candidatus Diapherotrites archaeon]